MPLPLQPKLIGKTVKYRPTHYNQVLTALVVDQDELYRLDGDKVILLTLDDGAVVEAGEVYFISPV